MAKKLQQLALVFFLLLLTFNGRAQRNRVHDVTFYGAKPNEKTDIN